MRIITTDTSRRCLRKRTFAMGLSPNPHIAHHEHGESACHKESITFDGSERLYRDRSRRSARAFNAAVKDGEGGASGQYRPQDIHFRACKSVRFAVAVRRRSGRKGSCGGISAPPCCLPAEISVKFAAVAPINGIFTCKTEQIGI